jgi:hypothetical protein
MNFLLEFVAGNNSVKVAGTRAGKCEFQVKRNPQMHPGNRTRKIIRTGCEPLRPGSNLKDRLMNFHRLPNFLP